MAAKRRSTKRGSTRRKNARADRAARAAENRPPGFPVVGIGASAGGLEAFKAFFAKMPADSGMAFVLVPHLDPEHPSAMRSLLAGYTAMPILEATDGVVVQPNHVYLIPPNAELKIREGRLRVAHPSQPRGQRMLIDVFFASLAADQAERAVSIILSGTGSDGTLGTVAVKENGGVTMAQYGGTLKYDSMPRHAQATGLIDFALPVEEMPQRLIDYTRHLSRVGEIKGIDGLRQEVAQQRLKICLLLRNKTGHDFSNYKESTFVRRVLRRMQVLQLDSAAQYLEQLRRDPGQIDLLFQELLIGVTQFFRDAKAFETLGVKVIPEILKSRTSANPVRVWVPGCASGEEAYSIAILFREQIAQREAHIRVQIFATDIDSHALEAARAGWYADSIARDVSPARLERFFTRERGGYRINKELRETCIFSMHNLVKDPPFSKLDLVSCRNLLIYLNGELQQRVYPLLHFALNPGGFLMLGPSENVTDQGKLFSRLDVKARIFRRRSSVPAHLPDLSFSQPAPRAGAVPAALRGRQFDDEIARIAERQIEGRRPAYVVVDEDGDIVRFSGLTGRYIHHANGAATLNLYALVEKSIRSEVRAMVQQAIALRQRIEHDPMPMHAVDGTHDVYVVAEPLAGPDAGTLWLVSFQSIGPSRAKPAKGGTHRSSRLDRKRIEQLDTLEAELMSTRERLQSTIEELETSNEELKSSNEEFQSLNEELQSANEELETSKEELQSVNEELETVNSELNAKVDSLDRANSDVKNLLENTQIATVFLSDDLRIKSFTPAITDVFNLIETDIGRPITDITGRLSHDLVPEVRRVQRTLSSVEREVKSQGSSAYIMRIMPYRTVSNVIDGVVITFVDVSDRKRAEEERALLAAIVRGSPDAIIVFDHAGRVVAWNQGAEATYGHTTAEMVGHPIASIVPPEALPRWKQLLRDAEEGEVNVTGELVRLRKDGARVHASVTLAAVRDAGGKVAAISAIERDIGDAKRHEQRQDLLLAELDHRVKNTLALVSAIVSHTLSLEHTPEEFAQLMQGRLRALGDAHRLLSQTRWQGTRLDTLVREQLIPFRGRRLRNVSMKGPVIMLEARAALTLALAMHELAANAAKYGSLSVPEGSLDLAWTLENTLSPHRVVFEWRESKGPAVTAPERRGFGSELIERAITYELGGSAQLDFARAGVVCRIEFPLSPPAPAPGADAPK